MAEGRILLRTLAVLAFLAVNAVITLAMVVAPVGSHVTTLADAYRLGSLAIGAALFATAIRSGRYIVLPVIATAQLGAFFVFSGLVLNA